jgi:anti-anti-sigma regulatory factor
MPTIGVPRNIHENCVVASLQEAGEHLDDNDSEVVLDFSSVHRIDSNALRAIEDYVRLAEQKSVKVVLRRVSVDVYKVLKLVRLTSRISFVN